MMYKKAVIVVLFLVLFSSSTFAAQNESTCSGFWESLSCFLWGNPSNRAGMSWFERGNVAGDANE